MKAVVYQPNNCAVSERTADGIPVGRCWCWLGETDICPRHGDVHAEQEQFRQTGRLYEAPVRDSVRT